MSTRRLAESIEGLNSSLALAAGDLWPKKGSQHIGACGRSRVECLSISYQGSHAVLNGEIGFQDFEKVLNFSKMYMKY